MNVVSRWFGERLPISGRQFRELTNEPVPYHLKRWWFALGGTPAYLFFVQIFTGILLAFYYEASPQTAYASVGYITNEASFGWFIRSLHKWAATLMIASVILHQMRVFFTGAYRKPREINWMIGMLLLICTLSAGFTGYSLVFEQLSYWGATVGANITESVPIVGGFLKNMMLAGPGEKGSWMWMTSNFSSSRARTVRRAAEKSGASGAIEPPIKTSRPEISRASRASLTASAFTASVSSPWLARSRRGLDEPNVAVSINSAPASM